ncbi:MAG: acetyl-CoA carboxylase biotin carboxyl carrier protein subunit, partial [Pseudomonadota bacterium]
DLEGGSGGESDPSVIVAPMPGKIIKVLKTMGDIVEEGETVVVMEAMKMEYNLKASQKRRVREIHCVPGQAVALGLTLVDMEEFDG